MKNVTKEIFYEGGWSEYYVDDANLPLMEKIQRISKLEEIEKEIKKKRKGVFSWLAVPVILSLVLLISAAINGVPSLPIRWLFLFVLSFLTITVLKPLAIKPIDKVKFRWRKWLLIILLWVAMINGVRYLPDMNEGIYSSSTIIMLVVLFFLAFLVFTFIYISLARTGLDEMIVKVKSEKQRLYDEITRHINLENLEPITLTYDIEIGLSEVAIFETDAVFLDDIEKNSQGINNNTFRKFESINLAKWFDNGDSSNNFVNKNKVMQDINSAIGGLGDVFRGVKKGMGYNNSVSNEYAIPEKDISNNRFGKIILTNKRILFVGTPIGFQIFYTELATCTLNKSQKEIINFETIDRIKTFAMDYAYYIKLYVDRLAREARK